MSDAHADPLADGVRVTDGTPQAVTLGALAALGAVGVPRNGHRRAGEARWQAVGLVWAALFPPAVILNLVLPGGHDVGLMSARTAAITMALVPVVVLVTLPLVAGIALRRAGR